MATKQSKSITAEDERNKAVETELALQRQGHLQKRRVELKTMRQQIEDPMDHVWFIIVADEIKQGKYTYDELRS